MDPISHPAAKVLREKALEIVSRPEYNLQSRRSDDTWIFSLLLEILDWILAPFRWLFELTEGLPDVLRWIIVLGLTTVLVVLIWHIVYSFLTAIRGPKHVSASGLNPRHQGIDPMELERLARESARSGDVVTAIRFLFRACVVRLELFEKRPNRPGTTNRELLRRYRNKPLLSEPLRQLVETIDRKWYGNEVCSDADFTACQTAHELFLQAVGEPVDAVRT